MKLTRYLVCAVAIVAAGVEVGCGGGSSESGATPAGGSVVAYEVKGNAVYCPTADSVVEGFATTECIWDAAEYHGQTCRADLVFVLGDPAALDTTTATNCH